MKGKYAKKLDKLDEKLSKLEFELADDEAEYNARKREELVGAGESVLSIFMGSRRTSRATTIARRRRMTSKAKREISETKEDISRVKKNISKLEVELKKAVDQIIEKFEKCVLPLFASGKIEPLVDARFALADAAEAHRLMEKGGHFGKIVLSNQA